MNKRNAIALAQLGVKTKAVADAILQGSDGLVDFARYFLESPYHTGAVEEAQIALDGRLSLNYARDVVKGPWKPGEAAILAYRSLSLIYARDCIKGPWPACEAAISQDPGFSLEYATDVLHGRFLQGEPAIASVHTKAVRYAVDVLKGPFPNAELGIALYPGSSFAYALGALGGRFPLGEKAISFDPEYDEAYREFISAKGAAVMASPAVWTTPNFTHHHTSVAKAGRQTQTPVRPLRYDLNLDVPVANDHVCEAVNVGFSTVRLACKTCGKDM